MAGGVFGSLGSRSLKYTVVITENMRGKCPKRALSPCAFSGKAPRADNAFIRRFADRAVTERR